MASIKLERQARSSRERYSDREARISDDVPPPYSRQLVYDVDRQKLYTNVDTRMLETRPAAIPLESLKGNEAVIDCPECRMRARTMVERYDTGATLFLRLLVFPLGCIDRPWRGTMNAAHFCGNCATLLAIYQPFNGGIHDQRPHNYGPAD